MVVAFVSPGPVELIALLLIAVLLFGASKLPELARSSGQAMGEFQKGRQEVEQELEKMKGNDSSSDTDSPSVEDPTSIEETQN